MSLKKLNYIRGKKDLKELYISQYSIAYIVAEINEILTETRNNITAGMRVGAHLISTLEALIFIDRNGLPDGYELSEELKVKWQLYQQMGKI